MKKLSTIIIMFCLPAIMFAQNLGIEGELEAEGLKRRKIGLYFGILLDAAFQFLPSVETKGVFPPGFVPSEVTDTSASVGVGAGVGGFIGYDFYNLAPDYPIAFRLDISYQYYFMEFVADQSKSGLETESSKFSVIPQFVLMTLHTDFNRNGAAIPYVSFIAGLAITKAQYEFNVSQLIYQEKASTSKINYNFVYGVGIGVATPLVDWLAMDISWRMLATAGRLETGTIESKTGVNITGKITLPIMHEFLLKFTFML